MYTHTNDSIVIESESDSDGESEDAKKEHKLINFYKKNAETNVIENKSYTLFVHSDWNVPHIEIASPPPDLG